MKKRVYIFNHYAALMYRDRGGRHYQFAQKLINKGYEVVIFSASSVHNSDINYIKGNAAYATETLDGIPFVFIKTRSYTGNGASRILNMLDYYFGLFKCVKHFDRPDVIIGSSVHPLTCLAALKLGKRYSCPVVSEIRDLWPESIVAYNVAKKENLLVKALYALEKKIYTKSDAVIFTMEGGSQYITDRGWDMAHGGTVDLSKVYHINNGIDLAAFDKAKTNSVYPDPDLDDPDIFKVVYTGSVRKANNIGVLNEAAELLAKNDPKRNIKILIFGSGDELESLKKNAADKALANIVFKGRVEKEYIPSILSRADLCILDGDYLPIMRYGASPNKLFDYIASGEPVLTALNANYDLLTRYGIGTVLSQNSGKEYYAGIKHYASLSKAEYETIKERSRGAAEEYDYEKLTQKLIAIIESL